MQFLKKTLAVVFLATVGLTVCTVISAHEKDDTPRFDTQDMAETGKYTYSIHTDSETEINFDLRLSKTANDVFCKKATIYSSDRVTSGRPSSSSFGFSRMGSPRIALYEWHLCVEIDGVTYKAWRGFDPGPGAVLQVSCNILLAQLKAHDVDTYLCHLDDVKLSEENFDEYSARCEVGEFTDSLASMLILSDNPVPPITRSDTECRRFESREELVLWDTLNSDPNLAETLALALFVDQINKELEADSESYVAENRMTIYLRVVGSDPSEGLLHKLRDLGLVVRPSSDWQNGLVVRPGSDWQSGQGMRYSIGDITPINENAVSVTIETYCGPLCASSTTVILRRADDAWNVSSSEMNWVSHQNRHYEYRQRSQEAASLT